MLVKNTRTWPQGAPYKKIQRTKEFVSNARVVVKTTNVENSRYFFLPKTTRNFSKVRAAWAARLFFTIRPIKFVICDVFILVAVEDAKAPHYPGASTKLKFWRGTILRFFPRGNSKKIRRANNLRSRLCHLTRSCLTTKNEVVAFSPVLNYR